MTIHRSYLNVKGSVEAHQKISFLIFVKYAEECFLEDSGSK